MSPFVALTLAVSAALAADPRPAGAAARLARGALHRLSHGIVIFGVAACAALLFIYLVHMVLQRRG